MLGRLTSQTTLALIFVGLSYAALADDEDESRVPDSPPPKIVIHAGDSVFRPIRLEFGRSLIIAKDDIGRYTCAEGFLVARTLGARRFRIDCL